MEPPPYKDFGVAEYNDQEGREYRRPTPNPIRARFGESALVLFARVPIRRRTKKEIARSTPLGGNVRNEPGMPRSLSEGMRNPKWPQPRDVLRLTRIGTSEVYEARIHSLFARARRSTAVVYLESPGLKRIQ